MTAPPIRITPFDPHSASDELWAAFNDRRRYGCRHDPLALRGRLGSGFVRSIAAACCRGLR